MLRARELRNSLLVSVLLLLLGRTDSRSRSEAFPPSPFKEGVPLSLLNRYDNAPTGIESDRPSQVSDRAAPDAGRTASQTGESKVSSPSRNRSERHATGEGGPSAALTVVKFEGTAPVWAKETSRPDFLQVVCIHGEAGEGEEIEGSGFLVAPGYVVASGHQAKQAKKMTAQFQDGSTYPSLLLSESPALDLALLQIPISGGTPLMLAADHSAKAGEPIRAVGCPYGLGHSIVQGIISAPERRLKDRPVLQIDAPINPGNSGGPLLNRRGEVIGVVLGMLPEARGIGFAVPIRNVKEFLGESFFEMGTVMAQAQQFAKAADALSLSTLFRPQSAKAYSNLGEVFRRIQEDRKSERAFLRAIEISPDFADAHYNLGILYDRVFHNPQKAALHYRKFLILNPAAPEATQVAQWLAALEGTSK